MGGEGFLGLVQISHSCPVPGQGGGVRSRVLRLGRSYLLQSRLGILRSGTSLDKFLDKGIDGGVLAEGSRCNEIVDHDVAPMGQTLISSNLVCFRLLHSRGRGTNHSNGICALLTGLLHNSTGLGHALLGVSVGLPGLGKMVPGSIQRSPGLGTTCSEIGVCGNRGVVSLSGSLGLLLRGGDDLLGLKPVLSGIRQCALSLVPDTQGSVNPGLEIRG